MILLDLLASCPLHIVDVLCLYTMCQVMLPDLATSKNKIIKLYLWIKRHILHFVNSVLQILLLCEAF